MSTIINALPLLLVLPCTGPAGWIGDEQVSCKDLRHPEFAATSKANLCADAADALRRRVIQRVLNRAKAMPAVSEIEGILNRRWPSYDQVNAGVQAENEKLNAMARAAEESERDPLNDVEIWQRKVSKYATYAEWVGFRTALAGAHRRPQPPDPVGLTREEYAFQLDELRSQIIEAFFQRWVRTAWAAQANGRTEEAWSSALSDSFFADVIAQERVRREAALECPDIAASDFRQPSYEQIYLKERNP